MLVQRIAAKTLCACCRQTTSSSVLPVVKLGKIAHKAVSRSTLAAVIVAKGSCTLVLLCLQVSVQIAQPVFVCNHSQYPTSLTPTNKKCRDCTLSDRCLLSTERYDEMTCRYSRLLSCFLTVLCWIPKLGHLWLCAVAYGS